MDNIKAIFFDFDNFLDVKAQRTLKNINAEYTDDAENTEEFLSRTKISFILKYLKGNALNLLGLATAFQHVLC